MLVCPMCRNEVIKFKENCHVIPRAFVKITKINGNNIMLNFTKQSININQKDRMEDFWCASCETESGQLDSYAAQVLIHRTQGVMYRFFMVKEIFQSLKGLDYLRFKKFIISICIREYLYRKRKKEDTPFSKENFRKLKKEYFGKTDEMVITGTYLITNDPMSKAILAPVANRSNNGVNFQLLNFGFQIYFYPRIEFSLITLTKSGTLLMLETTHKKHGSFLDLQANYQKIVTHQKNTSQLNRIRTKY